MLFISFLIVLKRFEKGPQTVKSYVRVCMCIVWWNIEMIKTYLGGTIILTLSRVNFRVGILWWFSNAFVVVDFIYYCARLGGDKRPRNELRLTLYIYFIPLTQPPPLACITVDWSRFHPRGLTVYRERGDLQDEFNSIVFVTRIIIIIITAEKRKIIPRRSNKLQNGSRSDSVSTETRTVV